MLREIRRVCQFAGKSRLREKVGKVDRRNCKKIERTWLASSARARPRSREAIRFRRSRVLGNDTPLSRPEPNVLAERFVQKNSSFNSALSHRLIHWPGLFFSLFFNLCHRVVREINRTRTMLHSSDGTRFVFRDRGLIYRRNRRRQPNNWFQRSKASNRSIVAYFFQHLDNQFRLDESMKRVAK